MAGGTLETREGEIPVVPGAFACGAVRVLALALLAEVGLRLASLSLMVLGRGPMSAFYGWSALVSQAIELPASALMAAGAAGLFRRRRWGRKLALIAAVLRRVALAVYVLWGFPITLWSLAASTGSMGRSEYWYIATSGVVRSLITAILPLIAIWLLRQPEVKAVFIRRDGHGFEVLPVQPIAGDAAAASTAR